MKPHAIVVLLTGALFGALGALVYYYQMASLPPNSVLHAPRTTFSAEPSPEPDPYIGQSANRGIYRCQVGERVTYQDKPCVGGLRSGIDGSSFSIV